MDCSNFGCFTREQIDSIAKSSNPVFTVQVRVEEQQNKFYTCYYSTDSSQLHIANDRPKDDISVQLKIQKLSNECYVISNSVVCDTYLTVVPDCEGASPAKFKVVFKSLNAANEFLPEQLFKLKEDTQCASNFAFFAQIGDSTFYLSEAFNEQLCHGVIDSVKSDIDPQQYIFCLTADTLPTNAPITAYQLFGEVGSVKSSELPQPVFLVRIPEQENQVLMANTVDNIMKYDTLPNSRLPNSAMILNMKGFHFGKIQNFQVTLSSIGARNNLLTVTGEKIGRDEYGVLNLSDGEKRNKFALKYEKSHSIDLGFSITDDGEKGPEQYLTYRSRDRTIVTAAGTALTAAKETLYPFHVYYVGTTKRYPFTETIPQQ